MKYFSMFSGIGGFELGMPESWKCVGYSEIDKYAIQIYERHFPQHINYGDATKINPSNLPDFELLCGGFPCQAFSVAGKRRGFDDTRGTLFFDIARICKEKRPRYLLLENVKGLLSHDNGKTFQTILGVLADIGYSVQWQVLNSKDFGVPQNRERVFIVGHLRGTPRLKIFSLTTRIKPPTHSDKEQTAFRYPIKYPKRNQNTITGNYSYTVDTLNSGGVYVIGQGVRRLTPVECERLQGYPDNWTRELSDTQRYKCLGNAVTVNVIKAITSKFKR